MRTIILVAALAVGLSACDSDEFRAELSRDEGDISVARLWNEVLLESIRSDLARPTVHARNLWHISAAMYDAWAAFDATASPWLLGKTQNGYQCSFNKPAFPRDTHRAREQAISFAAYRIIRHRFANVPADAPVEEIPELLLDLLGYDPAVTLEVPVLQIGDDMMAALGYDSSNASTAYADGSPAALGNYIAACYIAYGLADGSNEGGAYGPLVYSVYNPPIEVEKPGNPSALNPNFDLDRWQQIQLTLSIDQSGNVVDSIQRFVGPEWGNVHPFSLTAADTSTCARAGFGLPVYHDPGPPPSHNTENEEFRWTHAFVARVSSQLQDPDAEVSPQMIDISPNNLGNIQTYPANFAERQDFYEQLLVDGTTDDQGYLTNPVTGAPYDPQVVPLADYARAIAEFWADGPASETPPGHWFVITNTVSDHPLLVRRFEGTGPELGPLEWDVKVYFALGGAMHDAAITAWSIKGCYDYIRPVSAIRAMADIAFANGPTDPDAIPLETGRIEVVQAGDMVVKPLVSGGCTVQTVAPEDVGKIKLRAWVGPCAISNRLFDTAGVDWILAENWWPYQRPTFVSPPFAGYISGHSTYSRTAAELLTRFTGDEYFPGGKSEFPAPQNEFLVFEDGPSVGLTLEWARYVDASDQCSLSRIWGGIHPPADDLPGRFIGMELGPEAFAHAKNYFNGVL